MRAKELKGHLDALLLAALEGGPRHGYAVIEALRQDSGGRPGRSSPPQSARFWREGHARLVPGLALVAVVALLAFAARSTRYRPIGRAGAAG